MDIFSSCSSSISTWTVVSLIKKDKGLAGGEHEGKCTPTLSHITTAGVLCFHSFLCSLPLRSCLPDLRQFNDCVVPPPPLFFSFF